MQKSCVTAAILVALLCSPLLADKSQKDKAKQCNQTADKRGLKGNERTAFMSSCMSAEETAGAVTNNASPQDQAKADKTKACEQEAQQKGLKKKERATFMSTCLGTSPTK